MKLELAPRAVAQAERLAKWWRENRPAAPTLFEAELRDALAQIVTMPQAGSMYMRRSGREYRRVLMPESHCHVYYRATTEAVRIVALWGATRERGPRL